MSTKMKRPMKPMAKLAIVLILGVGCFFGYTHFIKDAIPQSMKETVAEVNVEDGEKSVNIGVVTWPGYAGGQFFNGGFKANRERSRFFKNYGLLVNFIVLDDYQESRDAFKAGEVDLLWNTVDAFPCEAADLPGKSQIVFQSDSDTTPNTDFADILVISRDVTHATRSGQIELRVADHSTPTPYLTIDGETKDVAIPNNISLAFDGPGGFQRIVGDAGGLTYTILTGDTHDFQIAGLNQLQITETVVSTVNNLMRVGSGGLEFADANTTIDQVGSNLEYDVDTGGSHILRVTNTAVLTVGLAGLTLGSVQDINFSDGRELRWGGSVDRRIQNDINGFTFEVQSSDDFEFQVNSAEIGSISTTGSYFSLEKAAADADVANFGQLWVLNTIPNALMFTDDTGIDSNLTRGVHDIPTTAASWFLPTLEPATGLTNINFAPNDHDYKVFEFTSTTVDERIQLNTTLPRNIDLSNIDVVIKWSFGAGTGIVRWAIRAVGMGDNDSLDPAWGTTVAVDDTAGTADQFQFVTLTALAVGGTPGEGDEIAFEVFREGSNAGDTFDNTARIHSITLQVRKVRASAAV